MVSKGLISATALAVSLASAGAFAPGRTFLKAPLSPATYGIEKGVNVDGAVAYGNKLSQVCFSICERSKRLLQSFHLRIFKYGTTD